MLGKRYIVRADILNMPAEMWRKFHGNYAEGPFEGSIVDFLDVIGLPGGLSAKFDAEEKEFFERIYKLWRKRDANRT